jgi:small subunit ribosomal protein S16
MVKTRLFRIGTKKRPYYRIVAIDSRKKRQGRVLERLGTYDPCGGGAADIRQDAVDKWLAKGAQLSSTVGSLVRRNRRAAPADTAGTSEAETQPA